MVSVCIINYSIDINNNCSLFIYANLLSFSEYRVAQTNNVYCGDWNWIFMLQKNESKFDALDSDNSFIISYSLRHSNVLYAQYASMTEKLFTIPIICLVLFKIKPYVSYLFNCLQWMGKYTLEIYVLHLMIKHLLFLLDVNGILMIFVSIISSIILAPYVNRITNNLTRRTMQLLGMRI